MRLVVEEENVQAYNLDPLLARSWKGQKISPSACIKGRSCDAQEISSLQSMDTHC